MPAMIFLCKQCGEKQSIETDLSKNSIFKNNIGPICLTPQCGKELSPVVSMEIGGINDFDESIQHFIWLNK